MTFDGTRALNLIKAFYVKGGCKDVMLDYQKDVEYFKINFQPETKQPYEIVLKIIASKRFQV
jgi:hypothetical protein